MHHLWKKTSYRLCDLHLTMVRGHEVNRYVIYDYLYLYIVNVGYNILGIWNTTHLKLNDLFYLSMPSKVRCNELNWMSIYDIIIYVWGKPWLFDAPFMRCRQVDIQLSLFDIWMLSNFICHEANWVIICHDMFHIKFGHDMFMRHI